jgi:MoxR-like ATPase
MALHPLSPTDAETSGADLRRLLEALEQVVIGAPQVLHQLLVTVVAGGHALLEGVPGTAKTLSVRALTEALGLRPGRIQFTPDLMPSDITGVNVFNSLEQRFEFHRGPLFADLVLADEINRAPAKTQSALLEAMQERQITVDGVAYPLGPSFTVIATQNPIEYEGTYPLPEAQLDRFLLEIQVGTPERAAELEVLRRHLHGFDSGDPATFGLEAPAGPERVAQWLEYVADLVRATRSDPALSMGASPRASVALLRASQAAALIEGRDYVVPDDVRDLAPAVLRHRVLLGPEAEIDGATPDQRIQSALGQVPAPTPSAAAGGGPVGAGGP